MPPKTKIQLLGIKPCRTKGVCNNCGGDVGLCRPGTHSCGTPAAGFKPGEPLSADAVEAARKVAAKIAKEKRCAFCCRVPRDRLYLKTLGISAASGPWLCSGRTAAPGLWRAAPGRQSLDASVVPLLQKLSLQGRAGAPVSLRGPR